QLESYCSVSEKLVKSEFIKNINSLLTNQIDLPPLPPDNTSSTNIEDILLGR
uniref:Uncharacterized protein n=1 Tax=Amphimedon queenslandica TaxID=400682 RepID=A0A1X7TBX8_AMPQE